VLRVESSIPFRRSRSFGSPFPCVTLVRRCRSKRVKQSSQRKISNTLTSRGHERASTGHRDFRGPGCRDPRQAGSPFGAVEPKDQSARAWKSIGGRRCPRVSSAATPRSAPLPPHSVPNVLLSVQNVLPHKRRRFLLIDTVMPFFCNPQPRIDVDLQLLVYQSYHLTAFVARYIVSAAHFRNRRDTGRRGDNVAAFDDSQGRREVV
jgi:hypothetical protein